MKFLEALKKQLETDGVLTLPVKVTPSAPRSEIFDQLTDGTLKIRVPASPENGKANKALVKLLEKEFNAEIKIISGNKSPSKTIRLSILPI